jgi:hypothetical protein
VKNGEDGPCGRCGSLPPKRRLLRKTALERMLGALNGGGVIFGNPREEVHDRTKVAEVLRHQSDRGKVVNRTDRKRISEGEAKVTRAVPMRHSTFGAAWRGASKAS